MVKHRISNPETAGPNPAPALQGVCVLNEKILTAKSLGRVEKLSVAVEEVLMSPLELAVKERK